MTKDGTAAYQSLLVNQTLPVPSFVICNIIHIDRRIPDDYNITDDKRWYWQCLIYQ
jgi:hypothetical protein